jgi:hypothetical protein
MSIQTIGFDKVKMLRHARYFKNHDALCRNGRQAKLLRPNSDSAHSFERELAGKCIAEWGTPRALFHFPGCYGRMRQNAWWGCAKPRALSHVGGATFPYGIDPRDRNIRVAPTYPTYQNWSRRALLFLCTNAR